MSSTTYTLEGGGRGLYEGPITVFSWTD